MEFLLKLRFIVTLLSSCLLPWYWYSNAMKTLWVPSFLPSLYKQPPLNVSLIHFFCRISSVLRQRRTRGLFKKYGPSRIQLFPFLSGISENNTHEWSESLFPHWSLFYYQIAPYIRLWGHLKPLHKDWYKICIFLPSRLHLTTCIGSAATDYKGVKCPYTDPEGSKISSSIMALLLPLQLKEALLNFA